MSPVTKKKTSATSKSGAKKTAKTVKGKTVTKKTPTIKKKATKVVKKPVVKKEKRVIAPVLEKPVAEKKIAPVPEVKQPEPKKPEPIVEAPVVPPSSPIPNSSLPNSESPSSEPAAQPETSLPKVEIPRSITVKDFAVLLKVGVNQVIAELLKNGIMANINQRLDFDIATILAHDFGFEATEKKETEELSASEDITALLKDDEKNLSPRPPILSVMGHVDHGKTKLLDAIRGTTVMEGEAGGITQKIGAYQIQKKTKDGALKTITFLDTPGHQAFTAMRARGAKVTDIAILVVAADDGVKPQTVEAYEHAKAAGVPVVVAITKIDKENANPDRVKKELADIGLAVEEWGGSTVCAEVSAVRRTGIDELLELVLLVADMQDLKANANRPAIGTIIESRLDPSQGPVATVLIHTGTLRMRSDIVIGNVFGKIRTLINDRGERIESAGPSMPVQITGLSAVPHTGDLLRVVASKKEAQAMVEKSTSQKQAEMLSGISQQKKEGVKELKVVIKADSKGSLEALRNALLSLPAEKIAVKVIYAGTGNITNSDVMIASAGHGSIFGFNVQIPIAVQKSADQEKVKITTFDVIYHLLDEVQKVLLSMLEPEVRKVIVGRFKVLKIFFDGKGEQVVGGDVTEGKMVKNSFAKVYRGENIVGQMDVKTVQVGPEEIKEVLAGEQCGLKLAGNVRLAVGDMVECFTQEKVAVSLS